MRRKHTVRPALLLQPLGAVRVAVVENEWHIHCALCRAPPRCVPRARDSRQRGRENAVCSSYPYGKAYVRSDPQGDNASAQNFSISPGKPKEKDQHVFLDDKFRREYNSFLDNCLRDVDEAKKAEVAKEVLEWADKYNEMPLGAFVDMKFYFIRNMRKS
jgi:hypothetical protein